MHVINAKRCAIKRIARQKEKILITYMQLSFRS
jgi:hypothetical protein